MSNKKSENSLELIRHLLGSIDLSDVKDEKEMSEAEREGYCAQIFAVFPLLEKDMKKMLYDQLMFASNKAEIWEQVVFGRGTFNGISLLLEKWGKAATEYREKHTPKEEVDTHNPLPQL